MFTLIGPKKYDVPVGEMEDARWIAEANCAEVRIGLNEADRWNSGGRMAAIRIDWREKTRPKNMRWAVFSTIIAIVES